MAVDLGRIGVWTHTLDQQQIGTAQEAVGELEAMGFGAVWIPESVGREAMSSAALLLGGGELDGVRILAPRTVELMTTNHLAGGASLSSVALPGGYGEVGFDGMGFGLTVAVTQGPAATQVSGPAGEFMWGGAASTTFWVAPAEDLLVVFMTQLMPSGTFNFRGQLKALVYGALTG